MKSKLFIQTKKPYKPLTWFLRGYSEADREVDDIMLSGYKMLIVSIFFIGFMARWGEWSDRDD